MADLKSIITPVVSILCTAAVCVTGAVCVDKVVKNDELVSSSISQESKDAYLTEAEAAEYLGIDAGRLAIIRKNLKKLEGSYMIYSYVEDGKDVEIVVYQKDRLDAAMANYMKNSNSVNFKYLEEVLAKNEKAKK